MKSVHIIVMGWAPFCYFLLYRHRSHTLFSQVYYGTYKQRESIYESRQKR